MRVATLGDQRQIRSPLFLMEVATLAFGPQHVAGTLDTCMDSGVWPVNPKPQTIANPIGSINLEVPEVPRNPAPGHIRLDQSNAHQVIAGGPFSSLKVLMSKNDYWHKFIYQQEGNNTFFLARNCSGAIEKLCYSMLLLADPQGELLANASVVLSHSTAEDGEIEVRISITLQIVLGFTPVNSVKLNMQDNFSKTLQRRFEPSNRSLDLSEFHSDPQLAKIVYCPLSQPKTLYYILALAKKAFSNILELNLSHNDIEDIKSLDLFSNSPLRYLDLRYNQISDIDQLTSLQRVALVSLWLDRNPVCAKYGSEDSYVKVHQSPSSALESKTQTGLWAGYRLIVDGVVIGPIGFRRNHRNYMVKPSQNELVNDFIQHYFSLYDGDIRKKMQGLYHRDALYSLTATYLPGQTTSSTARLQEYMTESRNLRKLSDYTKSYNLLQHGQDRILEALCKLPPTQHDVYSFTVDVPFQTDNSLLINICGVFRETKATQTQPVRAFNRTFILLRMGEGEYQVTNEMVHISNATTEQNTKTFLHPLTSIPSVPTIASTADRVLTESEKAQMTQMFSQITEMNYLWSRKCLAEAYWDVKDGLITFVELYKLRRIPPEAFSKDEDSNKS
uniref:Nuclear RNA export factor 1 n=1 Tax=Timema shepardi TaxID=629360 RepID=A0A7R9AU00_TIMSH|nr:unnamed protein product [Timema shepardi]